MPRRKKATVSNDLETQSLGIQRIPFGTKLQWLASSLDTRDKEWLLANRNHGVEYVGEFLETLDESFNLTVKHDDKAGRYNAVLVCTDKEHPAAGCAVSSRAKTAFDAVYSLAYLVLGKWDGDWWEQAGSDVDDPWG